MRTFLANLREWTEVVPVQIMMELKPTKYFRIESRNSLKHNSSFNEKEYSIFETQMLLNFMLKKPHFAVTTHFFLQMIAKNWITQI